MDGKDLNTTVIAHKQYEGAKARHGKSNESPVDMVLLYVPIMALEGCVLILFIFRLWSSLMDRRRLKFSINHACHGRFSLPNRGKAALNRHLIYAPLFGRRHNREFRIFRGRMHMGTIPTRIETTLIISYSALNAVFCVVMIDWSKRISESLHIFIGTTGTLAIVNLIPLVITAGRNNPFIPILRVSFDTFNLVHRWIGRIIVAEGIAHALAVVVRLAMESRLIFDTLLLYILTCPLRNR